MSGNFLLLTPGNRSDHPRQFLHRQLRQDGLSRRRLIRMRSHLWHSRVFFIADKAAMTHISVYHVVFIFLLIFLNTAAAIHQRNNLDIVILDTGKELENESLPLHMGQRVYCLNGLRQSQWYEIKISYPASIPASFSIQLSKDACDLSLKNRRLLNTEKLIFKANFDNLDLAPHEAYILVTVEPAGVVAQPGALEREYILFNIVCDELSLGIPDKAWYVGMMAVLCLAVAFVIPYFLRRHLLPLNDAQTSDIASKAS